MLLHFALRWCTLAITAALLLGTLRQACPMRLACFPWASSPSSSSPSPSSQRRSSSLTSRPLGTPQRVTYIPTPSISSWSCLRRSPLARIHSPALDPSCHRFFPRSSRPGHHHLLPKLCSRLFVHAYPLGHP